MNLRDTELGNKFEIELMLKKNLLIKKYLMDQQNIIYTKNK